MCRRAGRAIGEEGTRPLPDGSALMATTARQIRREDVGRCDPKSGIFFFCVCKIMRVEALSFEIRAQESGSGRPGAAHPSN